MGADPIAMCGGCRKVIGFFPISACVSCINERYNININEKTDRVLNKKTKVNKEWSSHCYSESPCEDIRDLDRCIKSGHSVLIDPCW